MCLEKLGKIFLIAANIAFFIAGAALLILGIISIVRVELLYDLADLLTDDLGRVFSELELVTQLDLVGLIQTNAIIICVVGGVLFAIGFLGMCGACQMNATCLLIYAVIVLVILMGEFALGVYAYMNADKFEDQIQDGLRLALSRDYEYGYRFDGDNLVSSQRATEIGFDTLQIYLQCCGISNYSDWIDFGMHWNRTYPGHAIEALVPPSCCKIASRPTLDNFTVLATSAFEDVDACISTAKTAVNENFCYDSLRDIVLTNQNIIIIVFVIIIFVEFLATIVACYLKGNADKK